MGFTLVWKMWLFEWDINEPIRLVRYKTNHVIITIPCDVFEAQFNMWRNDVKTRAHIDMLGGDVNPGLERADWFGGALPLFYGYRMGLDPIVHELSITSTQLTSPSKAHADLFGFT